MSKVPSDARLRAAVAQQSPAGAGLVCAGGTGLQRPQDALSARQPMTAFDAARGRCAEVAVRRVYVVEPDAAHRAQLVAVLRGCGLAVTACASPADLVAATAMPEPGCIVLAMPAEPHDQAALLEKLLASCEGCPVVAVTPEADVAAAVRAMKLGAADVVVRPVGATALGAAVTGALAQLGRSLADASDAQAGRMRLSRLTRRERQVLEGMIRGEANKAIALGLGISPRTVEVHRAKVMEKLACRSLPEIVRLSIQAGVVVT